MGHGVFNVGVSRGNVLDAWKANSRGVLWVGVRVWSECAVRVGIEA